jgi:hypothetical protein
VELYSRRRKNFFSVCRIPNPKYPVSADAEKAAILGTAVDYPQFVKPAPVRCPTWFDAHLWAYAEHYGLAEIVLEDFPHGRMYGSVHKKSILGVEGASAL